MPKIERILSLDITPERFLENCSWNELQELNMLIHPEIRRRFDQVPACRICGCTDDDCRQCIEKSGEPCQWIEPDLCSACAEMAAPAIEQY